MADLVDSGSNSKVARRDGGRVPGRFLGRVVVRSPEAEVQELLQEKSYPPKEDDNDRPRIHLVPKAAVRAPWVKGWPKTCRSPPHFEPFD